MQVQAIYACGIVSDNVTADVYTNLSHSQIHLLIPVVIFTCPYNTYMLHTCYIKVALLMCGTSDSEGAVKNEEIQQILCVVAIIPQELPYSS